MSAIGHIRSPPCPNRRHSRLRGKNAPSIRPAGPTRRQPTSSCCNLASALPQAKPCANRVVTTRCQPVVTTRSLPQRTRAYAGLPQVTAPSDVLTARQNRRPCNAICTRPLPAGHVSRSAAWRTPSLGKMAQPDGPTCNSEAPSAPSRVPRRQKDDFGTKREWCPGSLVVPATLRRSGRTETLT